MLSRVASWHQGSTVLPIFWPRRCLSSSSPLSVILGKLRVVVDMGVSLVG